MKKRLLDIRKVLTASEKKTFTRLIILNALLSIADISCIALVFFVLNFYSGKPELFLSSLLQKINLNNHSLLPAILLIVIFILKSVAGYFISKAQFRYIFNVASRLSSRNLLLYLEGSYENHVNIDSAVWTRKICFQPIEFAQYVLSCMQQVINETFLIIVSVTTLALYNIKLLAIVSLVLLPAVFILAYITKKRLKVIRKNIQSANQHSLQYLNEAIAGYVESNIYNKNDFFIKRHSQSQFTVNRFIADMQVTQAIPNRFFETFAVIGLFLLIAVLGFTNAEGNSNLIMLGAFLAAAYKIIPGISRIINYGGQIKTYLFTIDELGNNHHPNLTLQTPFEKNIEKIQLKNISFSYNDVSVFNNLDCTITKNSLTGISGNSGKGKTTLIDLMLGFLSPHSGTILFNDKEVNAQEIKSAWPQFAYVKQTAFLLHDTILNNITLYQTDADEKKLNNILAITGLKDWIDQLPEGLKTIITETGKNISGGQRQRIAIARALFKDAPVIILDEPFNELDEASETSLLNYLKELSLKGKMILLVTHNTASFNLCDQVIYLDERTQ